MRTHGWTGPRYGRRHHRRRGAFGAAGLASIAAAIFASGCHDRGESHDRGEERRAERRIEHALDWLDVEGEARERARDAALALAREAAGLRDDGTRLARELVAEWRRDTPDAAALQASVDREIDALRTRAHRALDDVLALHGALDPEQRAEVADLVSLREHDHRHRSRR